MTRYSAVRWSNNLKESKLVGIFGNRVPIVGYIAEMQSVKSEGEQKISIKETAKMGIGMSNDTQKVSAYIKPVESFLNHLYNRSKRFNGKAKFTRIHKALTWKKLLCYAALKVLGNTGAYTPGVDGITKGIFLRTFDKQIEIIRKNIKSYSPREVMRVFIPKPNNDKRPLGIPIMRDRIIQEAVRMILEAIYEPVFRNESWGFRIGRSTQDCLKSCMVAMQPQKKMQYVLEFDIKKFFDNVNHKIMWKLLTKRIKDKKFKVLIWRMMKAPINDNGIIQLCKVGVPQGGVISPVLANIYLHEFDEYIERLKWEYTNKTIRNIKGYYHIEATRKKNKIGGSLMYSRYADDSVLFWNGSKKNLYEIKDKCKSYLRENLKIELNSEKTLITDIDKGFKFVGFYFQRKKTANSVKGKDKMIRNAIVSIPRKTEKKVRENLNKKLKSASKKGYDPIYAILETNSILNGYYHYFINTTFRSKNFSKMFYYAKVQFYYYLKRRGLRQATRFMQSYNGIKTFCWNNDKKKYYLAIPKLERKQEPFKNKYSNECDKNGNIKDNGSRYMQRKQKANITRLIPNDPIVPINADWRKLRLERLQLDGNKCIYCGKPATEVDHIYTKKEAKCDKKIAMDRNKIQHLRSLCHSCHLKRHGKKWSWDFVMKYIENFMK